MTKKVIKIIGVVFGAIAVLAGAIFGIMLLINKEDPVHPDALSFENTNLMVEYDETEPNKIYSFTIKGVANSGAEVNQTVCYVREVNTFANQNLITLCNSKGEPLSRTVNGYKTNCNTATYFKVNTSKLDVNNNYGYVQLEAVGDNGLTSATPKPLTISVDRLVKSVFLAEEDAFGNKDILGNTIYGVSGSSQELVMGLGESLIINYKVNPNYALKPISTMPEKNILLYFCKYTGDQLEYIEINENNIKNNSNISNLFAIEGETIKFIAPTTETNEIINLLIAMYPSYKAQENGGKITDIANQINGLVNTTVSIRVINTTIEDVTMGSGTVNTKLYKEAILAVKDTSLSPSSAISLDINMIGSNVDERYNNIKFNAINSIEKNIAYFGDNLTINGNEDINYSNGRYFIQDINNNRYAINLSNIKYNTINGDTQITRTLIDNLNDGSKGLKCTNGLAFLVEERTNGAMPTYKLQLLTAGTYLDFFYDVDGEFAFAEDFNYDTRKVVANKGNKNSWGVIPKSMPKDVENLCLMILVVNNDGTYVTANTKFKVEEEQLVLDEATVKDIKLQLGYKKLDNKFELIKPSHNFDEFVKIKQSSYNAFVFVVEYISNTNYPFSLLEFNSEVVKFEYNGKIYAIVGEFVSGEFNNVIKSNGNFKGTTVYVAQFKNAYDQTTNDYVKYILNNKKQDNETYAFDVATIIDDRFTVKVDYSLSADLFNSKFETSTNLSEINNEIYVVANTGNGDEDAHYVTFTSKINGLISNIYNAGQLGNFKFVAYDENGNTSDVIIVKPGESGNTFFGYDANSITVKFATNGETATKYFIKMLYHNEEICSTQPINVIVPRTSNISLYYEAGKFVELKTTEAGANNSAYLAIDVAYDDNYVYTFKLMDGNKVLKIYGNNFILNSESGKEIPALGFYAGNAYEGLAVNHSLQYSFVGEVATINEYKIIVNSLGEGYLNVIPTDANTIWKLKVVVNANKAQDSESEGFYLNIKNNISDKTNSNLSDFISYTYNKNEISLNKIDIDSVEVIDFGASLNTQVNKLDSGWQIVDLSNDSAIILTITKQGNDWSIDRALAYLHSSLRIVLNLSSLTFNNVRLPINYNSNFELSLNSDWKAESVDTEGLYYTNTSIVLAELSNNGEFLNKPVIKVVDKRAEASDIIVSYKYSANRQFDSVITEINMGSLNELNKNLITSFDKAGYYQILFNVDGASYQVVIYVKENLFIVANTDSLELTSVSSKSLNEFLKFYTYNDTVTFGLTENSKTYMYTNYDELDVIATESFINSGEELKISGVDNNIINIVDNATLNTGWLTDINAETSYEFGLTYNDDEIVILLDNDDVCTKLNILTANIKNKASFSGQINVEYKTYVNYDATNYLVSGVEGFYLSNITTENTNISVKIQKDASGKVINFYFVIVAEETFANTSYTAKLTFTFTDGTNILTYTTGDDVEFKDVVINPYYPEQIKNAVVAEKQGYDLINDVLNMQSAIEENGVMHDNSKVLSLVVESVNNPSLINTDVNLYYNEGYKNYNGSWLNNSCLVDLNSIVSNSAILVINYKISYENGVEFRFTIQVTITNGQTVDVVYPYNVAQSVVDARVTFVGNSEDALALNATQLNTTLYDVPFEIFETVQIVTNVFSNKGVVIDLANDTLLSLSRIVVKNQGNSNDTSFSIAKIAWSSGAQFAQYNNNIKVDGTKIVFDYPQSAQSWDRSYVIFKITSNGGAVGYYKVMLYYTKTGSETINTSSENFYQMSVNSPIPNNSINFIDNGTVLGNNELINQFKEAFKLDYDLTKMSLRLASATYTNGKSALDAISIGEDKKPATIGCNLANAKLNSVYNNTTLKIVIIYNDGYKAINIGTIIVYVQTLIEYNELTDTVILENINNYEGNSYKTGYYKATITNQETIPMPFEFNNILPNNISTTILNDVTEGFVVSENQTVINYNSNNSGEIVRILENNTILINNYADKQLTFTVNYKLTFTIDGKEQVLDIYVVYTLKDIILDNSSAYKITLGDDYSNNDGFDNKLSLKDVVKTYNKQITLTNNSNSQSKQLDIVKQANTIVDDVSYIYKGLSYSYDENNILYLEFDLPTSNVVDLSFTITLNNYVGTNSSINVEISLQPALKVVNDANSSNLSVLTNVTNDYLSPVGSQIEIGVDEKENSTIFNICSGAETFTTITALKGSSIDIEFSLMADNADKEVSKYVLTEVEGKYQTLNKQAETTVRGIKDNKTIGFVHLPVENTIVILTITIKNANTEYSQKVITYIKLAQTFVTLEAQYEIAGSNHDVVSAGQNYKPQTIFDEIEDDIKYLTNNEVANNIYNSWRLLLIDVNNVNVPASDYNLQAMGFTDISNINYITVSPFTLVNLSPDANGEFVFGNPIGTDNLASVKLNSEAGIKGLTYNFRVVSDGNGLIGDNIHSKTGQDGTITNYLTITGAKNASATIVDNNNNLFRVAMGAVAEVGNTNSTSDFKNEIVEIEGKRIYRATAKFVGVTVILEVNANNVKVFVDDVTAEIAKITLTLYGNGLIAQNFEIVYLNYTATVNNATPTYFGSQAIEMKHLFTVKQGNEIQNSDISYVLTSAQYDKYDDSITTGSTYKNDTAVKNLFARYRIGNQDNVFTTTGKIFNNPYDVLVLNNVAAKQIILTMNFDICIKGYVLQALTKTVEIQTNLKLTFDGNDIADNGFIINYAMTNKNLDGIDANTFSYRMDLHSNANSTVGEDYYTSIPLKVAGRDGDDYWQNFVTKLEITNSNLIDGDYKISGSEIILYKDYTGSINVAITVNLGENLGVKIYNVVINVLGLADFTYNGTETSIKGGGGAGYSAGDSVLAVQYGTVTNKEEVGILYTTTYNLNDGNSNYPCWGSNGYEIDVDASYVTTDNFNTSNGIVDLWKSLAGENDENSAKAISGNKLTNRSTSVTVNLPYISTSNSIYVIYKFTFSYKGYSLNKYITYLVTGAGVSINTQYTNVNVDTNIITVKESETIKNNYLPLIYWVEEYKNADSTLTYTIDSNKDKVLLINGVKYIYNANNDRFVNGNDVYSYPVKDGDKYKITYTDLANDSEVEYAGFSKEIKNLYNNAEKKTLYKIDNINTIDQYLNFINSLSGVNFTKVLSATDNFANRYNLVAINDVTGLFGIDLGIKMIFNNELNATITVVAKGGSSLIANEVKFFGNERIEVEEKFLSEIFAKQSLGSDLENIKIIGIVDGNASVDWVTNQTVTIKAEEHISEFTYNYQTFEIKSVEYELENGSNTNPLYSPTAKYNYINVANGQIVVLNATNGVYDKTCLVGAESYNVNINDLFSVWVMNGNTIEKNNAGIEILNITEKTSAETEENFTIISDDKSTITINKDTLEKLEGTDVLVVSYELELSNGLNMNFAIRFIYTNV